MRRNHISEERDRNHKCENHKATHRTTILFKARPEGTDWPLWLWRMKSVISRHDGSSD